jgi:alanine-glyoxylate transaminase/serine-glyoxylate transaminase/serine-pyruvate transaminase
MDFPTIDHRGPEFAKLGKECLEGMKAIFKMTKGHVFIYPASGTGAWEAAIVNTLSPGDRVLMFETGHFATLWRKMATAFGLVVDFAQGDWRHGVDPAVVESKLKEDSAHEIKAVMCVHNETSTGVASRVAEVRKTMDAAEHPALLMVDAISSLASIDFRHDEWGVDVTVGGSQKGLMLPPGLSFNAVSKMAFAKSPQRCQPANVV